MKDRLFTLLHCLSFQVFGEVAHGIVNIQNSGVPIKTALAYWSGWDKGRLRFGLLGGVGGDVNGA